MRMLPTLPNVCARIGCFARTIGDVSASRIVRRAPILRPMPGSCRMPRSSFKPARLSKLDGAIRRFFSMMTSAVPPEMIFVSSLLAARCDRASSSEVGCRNFIFGILSTDPLDLSTAQHDVSRQFVLYGCFRFMSLFVSLLFQCLKYFFGRDRQIEKMCTDRAADGVADCGARRRYGGFSHAMNLRYTMRLEHVNAQLGRHVVKRRNHIVGKIRVG